MKTAAEALEEYRDVVVLAKEQEDFEWLFRTAYAIGQMEALIDSNQDTIKLIDKLRETL